VARPGTYSIVVRDPQTGQFGVGVQSHWFSVGPLVPWARPGVGAVATQATVEVAYGPRALDLLSAGASATDALAELIAADPGAHTRQVAVVDAAGGVATHTGETCVPFAGHVTGTGVSCQGNMLASEDVWPAMLETFRASRGPMASRLLAALDAAELAGGDARGRQSAAILVVPAAGEPWRALVSLRVEDHEKPLVELRRLLALHEAYALADEADGLVGEGRHAEAAGLYAQASELAPGNFELRFWAGLGIAQGGDIETGLSYVREVIEGEPRWRELLARLPAEMAPAARAVAARLGLSSPDRSAPQG
jgi:uncharacterized Ntn-hydrolase superfamily protein